MTLIFKHSCTVQLSQQCQNPSLFPLHSLHLAQLSVVWREQTFDVCCTNKFLGSLRTCTYVLVDADVTCHRLSRTETDFLFRLQRSECDLREAQSANEQLKTTVEQLKRENAGLQERERQAKNRNKILASNLKTERDEVSEDTSVLDTQTESKLLGKFWFESL